MATVVGPKPHAGPSSPVIPFLGQDSNGVFLLPQSCNWVKRFYAPQFLNSEIPQEWGH